MEELLNQLISVGTGLGLLWGGYLLWWISGVVNAAFNTRKWSWTKMLFDFSKAFVASAVLLGLTALWSGMEWWTSGMGIDASTVLDGLSNTTIVGGIGWGIYNYWAKALKNIFNYMKLKLDYEVTGEQDYAKIASDAQAFIGEIVEYFAPAVEPDQLVKALPKKEAVQAIEDSQLGASVPVATVLGLLKDYATKKAFLKEDGSSGVYRGQCTQVAAFVYNQVGVFGSMGNGKDVVKNLVARGVAEFCDDEPGAIASADDGSAYGHTWVSLGNGYLIEQNAHVAGTVSADYGKGTVYSCRVGKLNEWNRGKVTYCRLKGLQAANAPETKPAVSENTSKPKNSDVIEYTYQVGDTFGEVITKLGLKTPHGLWGADGDVAYYTNQLREQGITGNIPVGTTIKLTPRK